MSQDAIHAIIGGPNKAGTTSAFRYLGAHPNVCASRIKETNFFREPLTGTVDEERKRYQEYFAAATADSRVFLDASPGYLKPDADIPPRIHAHLPDARLIFVLREPASRLLSYFRFNQQNGWNERVAALDLAEYIDLVEQASQRTTLPDPGPARNAMMEFQRGCYAMTLPNYLEHFSTQRVLTSFFDDLVVDPRRYVMHVARFLELDTGFYADFNFVVENKTRDLRFRSLQKLVQKGNAALEPLLNRYPSVRNGLRRAYALVNEQRSVQKRPRSDLPALVQRLRALYAPHNAALNALLVSNYPALELPAWLLESSSAAAVPRQSRQELPPSAS